MSITESTGLSVYEQPAARILATTRYPHFFIDRRILDAEEVITSRAEADLPEFIVVATAARARLLDEAVTAFMEREEACNIVWLGYGLDTAFDRVTEQISKRRACFYEVDTPEILKLRNTILKKKQQENQIACEKSQKSWIPEVNAAWPTLIVINGMVPFGTEDVLLDLIAACKEAFPVCEMVFDVIGEAGRHYCDRFLAKSNAGQSVRFTVSNAKALAEKAGVSLVDVRLFFTDARRIISRKLKSSTRLLLSVADTRRQLAVIHLNLQGDAS